MGKVDEMLAEMRRERERLAMELARADRVIAALEEAAAATADAEELVTTTTAANASLLPGVGPYSLLDIYEATASYLATVDEPKNSREIADALRAGGFKTRSRNLVNTVRVMLRRKTGRTTGISTTKDGKRWFVKKKPARRPAPDVSPQT